VQRSCVDTNTSTNTETNHKAKMKADNKAMFARGGKRRKNEGVVLTRREMMQKE